MPGDLDNSITYRWIDGPDATPDEWDQIDAIMTVRGWMSLDHYMSKILVAERNKKIVGLICIQLVPHLGPLFVIPSLRGTEMAAELSDRAIEYMVDAKARGWIAVASNNVVAMMCEERGMNKLVHPVYIKGDL